MHIRIVAVGKIKEKFINDGIKEYLKRLGSYAKVEIIEVTDEKIPDHASPGELEKVKQKEAERLSRYLKEGTYLIVLDISGKNLSSEELAGTIKDLGNKGKSDVTILVGGSVGLHSLLINQASLRLSFGRMTYPHQLMRVILLEQIYRSFKIIRGEPYHK
ncbi:MAG: 23S rRNA (pseudouridine(1915)-N(3))-methyltransferase RlmH [Bacillota bacterium]|jgi:23S rRNA (pseudouridine1915-N3)-methyltransferase